MIIWGNHSPTMYPDIENIVINGAPCNLMDSDEKWVENDFLKNVQQRGKDIINKRGASSETSAAKTIIDTIIACRNPTVENDCFSAAIESNGEYGVPKGLFLDFH